MQTSNRAHFASSQGDEQVCGACGSHEDVTTIQTHVLSEVFGGGTAQPGGKLHDAAQPGGMLHDAHIHLNACANADELAEYACEQGLPLISSMGGGNKLHPEFLQFADIYETKTCPLCRVMRKEARKRNIASLRVLYSSEQPAKTQVREGATRADRSDLGTMSYMPPIMGQMIAGWVIRRIVGIDADEQ